MNIENKKILLLVLFHIINIKVFSQNGSSSDNDSCYVYMALVLIVAFFLINRYDIAGYFTKEEEVEAVIIEEEELNAAKYPTSAQVVSENLEIEDTKTFTIPRTNSKWLIIGQSVIGKSHIENDSECQDNCSFLNLEANWGIAVVCDGAGSAKHSQLGSKFVAKQSLEVFQAIINKNNLINQSTLPALENWQELARRGLYQTYLDLEDYSKREGLRIESLACTVIVVIYSPLGYLVTHIGDGRAGYLTEQNEWKALITPWKGEEANQTVFITSPIWNSQIDTFIESNIFNDKSRAFTIISDGCENHSFECSQIDRDTGEWIDPNRPFPNFFNPLINSITKLKKSGESDDEITKKLKTFIESGTEGLKNEPDDKTLILGILQTIE